MDVDRLKQLFTACYDENEGTRNNAVAIQYRYMKSNGIHPIDLVIEVRGERHARHDRILQRHVDESTQLRRELAFYREHADPKLLAKAAKAGQIENRWDSFRQLIGQRLNGFPRGWKSTVVKMIGVTSKRLTLWEQGLARIPDVAFEDLRTAALPEKKPRAPRKRKQPATSE